MKKTFLLLCCAWCMVGCKPKVDAPRDVRALRRQQRKSTIALPVRLSNKLKFVAGISSIVSQRP